MLELIATPILELLIIATFTALIITSILIVADKTGIRNWAMLYAPSEFISKIIECNFCLTHHVVATFIAGVLIVDFDFLLLFVPLMTATITSKLMK